MRPRVLVNMASSLDGKINPEVRRGPFVMSRHAEDRRRMLALRAQVDAVLIGAGNLRADDPDLAIADDARAARGGAPLRVLVTRRGEAIRGDEAIFDPARGGETIVAHGRAMGDDARRRLSARATRVELGDTDVDVAGLLAWLGDARRCRTVLSEGGAVLNGQLFAARLVDELYLTLVPRILGGAHAPTAVGAPPLDEALGDATLLACDVVGSEVFLRYAFAGSER